MGILIAMTQDLRLAFDFKSSFTFICYMSIISIYNYLPDTINNLSSVRLLKNEWSITISDTLIMYNFV